MPSSDNIDRLREARAFHGDPPTTGSEVPPLRQHYADLLRAVDAVLSEFEAATPLHIAEQREPINYVLGGSDGWRDTDGIWRTRTYGPDDLSDVYGADPLAPDERADELTSYRPDRVAGVLALFAVVAMAVALGLYITLGPA